MSLLKHGMAGLVGGGSAFPTYDSPVGGVTPKLILDFHAGVYAVDTGSGLEATTTAIITNFTTIVTGGGDGDGISRMRTVGGDTPQIPISSFDYVTASGSFLIVGRYDAVAAFDRTFMFNYDVNNRIGCTLSSGSEWRPFLEANGVETNLTAIATWTTNTDVACAAAYTTDDAAASTDGETVVTDSTVDVPGIAASSFAPTTLLLGHDTDGREPGGGIQRFIYWGSRLSNADLEALSS